MASVHDLITEGIDIWTSATRRKSSAGRGSGNKIELYGVERLRKLILELAVRGLLVPQKSGDEPASVFLDRIATKKEKSVSSGKINKTNKSEYIHDEVDKFDLPMGWERVSLTHFGVFTGGKTPSKANPEYWSGDIPWVTPKDMKLEYITNSEDLITEKGLKSGLSLVPPESLLFVARSGILRRKFPVAINKIECTVNQDLKVLNLHDKSVAKYLLVMMQGFESFILRNLTKTGTTVESLRVDDFCHQLFIVPPLPEQHRIVAKVDELMILCDQLEQQTESSLTAHQTLVQTLLSALTQAAATQPNTLKGATDTPTPFTQAWNRLAEHFDTVFTTEDSIEQLKQTILQLAVMGKLAPQDPNDEPASELLERIAVEKAELVKAKKIKKQKALPELSEEEKPFELPIGWEWSRIATIAVVGTGSTPSRDDPSYYSPADYNWVTSGETSQEYITTTKEMVSRKATIETNVSIFPVGTLIVAMYGQGKTRGQITELKIKAGTNQACAAMQLIENSTAHRAFIKLFFRRSYDELRRHAAGGAQPNLNVGKISLTVLPVPPLPEQHRIVAKVEELMTLSEQLKTLITDAQNTQLQLADAVTEQAIHKQSLWRHACQTETKNA